MSLHENMIRSGHTIFKWRSYIPLLFIIPLLLALRESAHLEEVFGEVEEDLWVLASFLLSLSGIAVRCFTVGFVPGGTSGRNTQSQRATHLNTTGMYSVVRNPLYLGNFIIILGVMASIGATNTKPQVSANTQKAPPVARKLRLIQRLKALSATP